MHETAEPPQKPEPSQPAGFGLPRWKRGLSSHGSMSLSGAPRYPGSVHCPAPGGSSRILAPWPVWRGEATSRARMPTSTYSRNLEAHHGTIHTWRMCARSSATRHGRSIGGTTSGIAAGSFGHKLHINCIRESKHRSIMHVRPRLTITNSEPMLPADKKEVRVDLPIQPYRTYTFIQSAAAAAYASTLPISSRSLAAAQILQYCHELLYRYRYIGYTDSTVHLLTANRQGCS
eukprot:COSAG01_NODE_262_length_19995_cov_33.452855_8_plen_232_part_00